MSSTELHKTIECKLREQLCPSHLIIDDISGPCGANFQVKIVSDIFEGKTLLARQRLVNAILSEELKSIHAFSLKCYTLTENNKL